MRSIASITLYLFCEQENPMDKIPLEILATVAIMTIMKAHNVYAHAALTVCFFQSLCRTVGTQKSLS